MSRMHKDQSQGQVALAGDAGASRTPESVSNGTDAPPSRAGQCETVSCSGVVLWPDREAFCTPCLIAQRNAAHLREQEVEAQYKQQIESATPAAVTREELVDRR